MRLSSTAAVPAASASCSLRLRSEVKIGVSRSSPSTIPAWRAAIVQPPCTACPERPASARCGERRQREPQPGADRDLREDRPHDAGVRQPGESREPARDQDRARGGPRPERADPTGEARGRDRSQRHDRHDEPRRQRLEPPAVDQQDHEQEERGHERARDEQERCVRGDLRPLRRARAPGAPARREARGGRPARPEPGATKIDSQPKSCVRIPPTAGPTEAPTIPASAQIRAAEASAPVASESRSSAATTTAAPATPCTARSPTSTPNVGENAHARDAAAKTTVETPNTTDRPPTRKSRRGHRRERECQVERDQRPGERRDLDVELHEDLRQRERDDRRVGQDEPDREAEQRNPVPRSERLHEPDGLSTKSARGS